MNTNNYNFRVAIHCMTFNHKPYIQQCLDGFVMQKTKFPFLAVVVDDASTDGEQEVLWDFINNELDTTSFQKDETDDYVRLVSPHKTNKHCIFIFVLLKYNHYSIRKAKEPYFKDWEEKTKYFAICEGDDYWTDPLKLQKQVDYLERHPECGLVYTNSKILNQKEGKFKDTKLPRQADFETLLFSSPIMTLTTCFRADIYNKYSYDIPMDKTWQMGDLPLWLYIASQSEIKYLPDVTSVYRMLNNSASHFNSLDKSVSFCLSSYKIRCFFAEKYNRQQFIKKICIHHINELMKLAVSYDKSLSVHTAKTAIKDSVFSPKVWIKIILYSTSFGRKYHKKKYS